MSPNSNSDIPGYEPVHGPAAALDALRSIESRVRPDFRKTVVFGTIALAALIGGEETAGVHAASVDIRLVAYGCALLVVIFGVAASRTAAREAQRVTVAHAGTTAAAPVRVMVLLVGYLIAAIACCDLLDVNVGHLLIGGAVAGIVLGLAAQPVLGNLFAGLVLLFARPYLPGQHIRVLSGAINGPHDGVVVSAGLLYTMLQTPDGPLNIPNSTLLAAAVGPAIEPTDTPADRGSAGPDDAPAGSDADPDSSESPAATAPEQKTRDLAEAVAEGEAVTSPQTSG
ncbi:MAG TPA: mechanosensitive ion channel family protein [Micromonosporaceae bacterium]